MPVDKIQLAAKMAEGLTTDFGLPEPKRAELESAINEGYKNVFRFTKGPNPECQIFAVFILELNRLVSPHTTREMCKRFGYDITTINGWIRAFRKANPARYPHKRIAVADYMERFFIDLAVPPKARKKAIKLAQAYDNYGAGAFAFDPSIDAQCLIKLACAQAGIELPLKGFSCCALSLYKREEYFREIGIIK